VCAVITVGLLHRLISGPGERHARVGAIVHGLPLVVLQNGQWQREVMRKMRLQEADVMAAARAQGLRTMDQIKYAILERQGGISIIKHSS